MRNKETAAPNIPEGLSTIRLHLTAEAVGWLEGTTKDDGNHVIGNHSLFYSLLSRMRLAPGIDSSFRRPQELQPGQFQYSETGLAAEWNMGRKKVRNLLAAMQRMGLLAISTSKVASVASVTCMEGWTGADGIPVSNPFYSPANTAKNGI